MFTVKNILRITDFDFEDGSDLRDKYLLILFQSDEDAIIAPLTTSVDKVPDHFKTKRCIQDTDSRIHCYYIPKGIQIGESGFFFKKDTFIHIHPNSFATRKISYLTEKYLIKNLIDAKDVLHEQEYCDLIYCMYKSSHVPRGIKSSLGEIIEEIESRKTIC